MKLNGLFLLLLLGVIQPARAQFADDFSDGNLDGWQGDVTNYIVNASNQLQLNAPSGSTMSWIHVPVTFADSMTWELYFKLDFAPSTSNQLRIYLGLNSNDLASASGYYLEIGASGDQDAIDFKYANNGVGEIVASSAPGLVAAQPVEMILRVTKNETGDWQFFRLGGIPELLFTASDNRIPLSQLNTFGLYTKYTDTRRDKFFFDNILIQAPQPDLTAPQLVSLEVLDENSVRITFDEAIESTSANTATNYVLTPGNSNPDQVNANGNVITLTWNTPFVGFQSYLLNISGLRDAAGNVITPETKDFTYIVIGGALPYELLITEIMADPTPQVGLPDAEYVEIYNHGSTVFRLSDYTLTVGSSERALPDEVLFPGQFAAITDNDNVAAFTNIGRAFGIDLPSLTNSGTYLAIKKQTGEIIHDLTYSTSWYKDPDKEDGGWSLEMINPNNICSEASNWAAANNLLGGTPGSQNSIWGTTPDTQGPILLSIYASSPNMIQLRFDEKLFEEYMNDTISYQFQPDLIIQSISFPDPTIVEFTLTTPLQPGTIYTLTPFEAYDCLGNKTIFAGEVQFGLIVDAQPGDVLINEILFNPYSGGSRFIEVINHSDKFINLNSLAIGRLTMSDTDIYPTGVQEVLGPGEIAAFTPNRQDILSRYTVPFPNKLYEADLPAWDDESDNVSLLANGVVIDSFTYSSDWHHPGIADQNGVSLERVSVEVATTTASNWHSASSLEGYATPTGANSQRITGSSPSNDLFTVDNRNFSPDDDGYKDFLTIQFNEAQSDYIVSAWIYDHEGREVLQLLSNEIVGANSLLTWDGRDAEQQLSDAGIYIILVRLWAPNGDAKDYQESCALIKRTFTE